MKILIVEDEALVAMEIEQILVCAGYDVVGVADHQLEAVAIATAERPDITLVDVRLADGESGLDVARALGQHGIPVVFLTGTCPRDDGIGIALACLHKPFSDRGLLDSIDVLKMLIAGEALPAALPPTLHIYHPPVQVAAPPDRADPLDAGRGLAPRGSSRAR